MKKKTVSLVLGSGGARGYAHIGVIKELEKQGYEIKSIYGSSIGALIGGLYAAGKLDEYINWVKELNILDILNLIDFSFNKDGMINGDKVFNKIEEILDEIQNIEDLPISFVAAATDIINKEEVWIEKGSLKDAIRASIAIPTIFTSKQINGKSLFDGGILNPIPIPKRILETKNLLVVVNLNSSVKIKEKHKNIFISKDKNFIQEKISDFMEKNIRKKESLSYFELINKSIEAMQELISSEQLRRQKPDIMIEVPSGICDFYDFHKAVELIEYGQEITKDILEGLK